MSNWRAFVETVHLSVLGLWAGVLVGVGACVGVLFPAMKATGVRLPEFASDGAGHYRIAAGVVAQKVFLIGDLIMFPLAIIAAITFGCLVVLFKMPVARLAAVIRAAALSVALASMGALLLVVTPGINAASRAHWAAAKIGDAAAEARHIKGVDDLHPIATLLMFAEFAGVLIALIAGAWSIVRANPAPIEFTHASRHPEPELLKSRGRR